MSQLPDLIYAGLCGHCGLSLRGYASSGDDKLCHPDTGMDCYKLVTLYKHEFDCEDPKCLASIRARGKREENSVVLD